MDFYKDTKGRLSYYDSSLCGSSKILSENFKFDFLSGLLKSGRLELGVRSSKEVSSPDLDALIAELFNF